jgi:fucose permease
MVVGHAGFIVFAYCIAESAIGTWLATFVFVKGLADESVAALFVSAFWGGLVCDPKNDFRRP